MAIQSRIVASWVAIIGSIGIGIGALTAQITVLGMIIGAGIGVLIGAFVGISIAINHWHAVWQLTNEVSEEALASSHTRTIYVLLPYDSTFKLAKETLRLMLNCRPCHADIEHGDLGGMMQFPTDSGKRYWVSHVHMKLIALNETRTQVTIDCHPRTTLWAFPDYGRNLDIIQRITRFLESVSAISATHHG